MRRLVPFLPSAAAVYHDGACFENDHLLDSEVLIPEALTTTKDFVIFSARAQTYVDAEDGDAWGNECEIVVPEQLCTLSQFKTLRLTQRFAVEVKLPPQAYGSNWSRVNSLGALDDVRRRAAEMQRMLIVVCSKQNELFWEPKILHSLALEAPRLMFASIDRDVANSGYGQEQEILRIALLGFDYIDGVSFVSHGELQQGQGQREERKN